MQDYGLLAFRACAEWSSPAPKTNRHLVGHTRPRGRSSIMGNRQSKQNKKTKESQRRDKPTKKRLKRVKAEPSKALQRSTGASSRGYDVQAPILSIVIEPRSSKKVTTIADTPKSMDITQQPKATTTTSANGTVLDSHHEEQAVVVEVEEKKLLTVSDMHSTVATAPESSRATAEATRKDKHGKGTQEESKSAQETLLKHKPRAQDGCDQTSSKKPVQRKRYRRTGRHGEHLL